MAYFRDLLDGGESKLERENRALAYEAALEGIVLLENDGALPVKPGNIALFGAGASRTVKGGTGSGEVNERRSVSILEGLESRGFVIKNRRWLNGYEVAYQRAVLRWREEMKRKLRTFKFLRGDYNGLMDPVRQPVGRAVTPEDIEGADTDTAVFVVARQAGEGADRRREEYSLASEELESLRVLRGAFSKLILIINAGGSMDLSAVDEIGVNAVVFFGQEGEEGGNALADVLSGAASPSGKLTATWAKKYEDIPFANEYSYLNGNTTDEYYREGIFVDYRYFDTFRVEPRYPFGYGLSYTSFELSVAGARVDKSRVTVTVRVKNTGNAPGREVAQCYVSAPEGEGSREYQRLVAFEKTPVLAAGEEHELTLSFDMADCASVTEDGTERYLDAGEYTVRVGTSSRDTVPAVRLRLARRTVTAKLAGICPPEAGLAELSGSRSEPAGEDCPVLTVEPEDIACETPNYDAPESDTKSAGEKAVEGLSDKELCKLVVGVGYGKEPRYLVPGYTGLTAGEFGERGIAGLTMSDGPAGLRLQARSALTRSGRMKMVDFQFAFLEHLPGAVKAAMVGKEGRDRMFYQYATAFPAAICLAQSWNRELARRVGRAVGLEMERFGVNIWLAPAMNIIRNPLCGRNFEYLSADPVLAGNMAAELVRGVQSVPGRYATVKHFACNNQEDNREHSNSRVSQRALREIYLRGFEIAVKSGGARAVMTSYNMVNGVYAPESRDLCTLVLRREWGFGGVVMSDWYSTRDDRADTAKAIAAGNDLVMPGGGEYAKKVLRGLREGKLKRGELRLAAGRVAGLALEAGTAHEPGWFEGKELFKKGTD